MSKVHMSMKEHPIEDLKMYFDCAFSVQNMFGNNKDLLVNIIKNIELSLNPKYWVGFLLCTHSK